MATPWALRCHQHLRLLEELRIVVGLVGCHICGEALVRLRVPEMRLVNPAGE